MACDDGFGFMDDVSIPVYGYCSGNTDGNNEFTLDGTDGCYGNLLILILIIQGVKGWFRVSC